MKHLTSLIILGFTGIVFYFALYGSHGYMHLLRSRTEAGSLQQKSESLDKEIRDLRRRIAALEQDPETLEKHAREQVGFSKPGETVYIFPSKKASQ